MSLFHQVGIIYHVGIYAYLFESFVVHEVVTHVVFIKELVGPSFDTDDFDFFAGIECVFQDPSIFQVSHFYFYKCSAFTWFNMLEPYD
ncbi:hypothetical protein SDC9_210812 [bioreactor metagenome]|uniref:Uncharacterized protein n=1 Tax=bioreactor metagenome TaxID=1076179 RepID=A0A645JH88_9ZZZZ